jgi:hypothetical protein
MEPVKSAVKSSELGTNHYNGPSYMGKTEELFSVNYGNANNGFTVSPSFAFSNTSGAQTWEKLMAHTTTYSMVDGYLVFNSSNTSTAFTLNDIAKYGFAHNQDESADYMDGWIGSTVGNHAIDIVKPNKEEGIIEFEDKILDLNKYDMTTVPNKVTDFSGSVPINKFGLYLSKNENVRQEGSGGGHHYSNNHKRENNFGDSGFMDSLDYRKIQEISDITEKSNAGKGSNLEITAVDRNNNPETSIESDADKGNFQKDNPNNYSNVLLTGVYSTGEDGAIYSKIGITNEYHSKHASADDIEEATESISKEDGRATNKDVSEDSDAVESENTSE